VWAPSGRELYYLGLPDAAALFNADGSRRPGAGRITTTATPARQVQVGVKWVF